MKETSIDHILAATPRPRRRNMVADNEPLALAIGDFLRLKSEEDPRVQGLTLRWFYEKKLRALYGGPSWYGTIRRYVHDDLKLNIDTGKSL